MNGQHNKKEGILFRHLPIIHAMLLMIGNLYANREPVAFGTVVKLPYSYEYLIGLYKHYEIK